VLTEIEAEEPPQQLAQQLAHHPSKPGSIHKNSGIPPLDPRQNHKSMDTKKRLISMYERSEKKPAQATKISRELNPLIPKGEKKANQTTFTVDLERVSNNPAFVKTKERIPHSAFYMHKLHKRVSTANNEEKSVGETRSKGEVLDELRNFTKKIAERRNN
jgi:hypothetical protein